MKVSMTVPVVGGAVIIYRLQDSSGSLGQYSCHVVEQSFYFSINLAT